MRMYRVSLSSLWTISLVLLSRNNGGGAVNSVRKAEGCFRNLQVYWDSYSRQYSYNYFVKRDKILLDLKCTEVHSRLHILSVTHSIPSSKDNICDESDAEMTCQKDSEPRCYCCTKPPADNLCSIASTDILELTEQCRQDNQQSPPACQVLLEAYNLRVLCANQTDFCTQGKTCLSRWITVFYQCIIDREVTTLGVDLEKATSTTDKQTSGWSNGIIAVSIVTVVIIIIVVIIVCVCLRRKKCRKNKSEMDEAGSGATESNETHRPTGVKYTKVDRKKKPKDIKVKYKKNSMYEGFSSNAHSKTESNKLDRSQGEDCERLVNNNVHNPEYDTPKHRYGKPLNSKAATSSRLQQLEDDGIYSAIASDVKVEIEPPDHGIVQSGDYSTPKSPPPQVQNSNNSYDFIKSGDYSTPKSPPPQVEDIDNSYDIVQSGEYSVPKSPPPQVNDCNGRERSERGIFQSGEYSTPKSPPPKVTSKEDERGGPKSRAQVAVNNLYGVIDPASDTVNIDPVDESSVYSTPKSPSAAVENNNKTPGDDENGIYVNYQVK